MEYKKTGTSFEVFIEDNYYGFFDLPIYGKHQLLDALAVIAVCYYERLSAKEVSKVFKQFQGAKRRFHEEIIKNNILIDDYAHHPNEVAATLDSVKQKYPDKKVVAIFQPHTFSRTKEFAPDLVKVFQKVDKAYIMDIYPSREKQENFKDITSRCILDHLENGFSLSMDDASVLVQEKDAVYVFMSPNDISKLEKELQKILGDEEK